MAKPEPRKVRINPRTSIRTDPAFQTARQILQQSLGDFHKMSESLGLPLLAGPDISKEMATVMDPANEQFLTDMVGSDVRFKPEHFEIILDVKGYAVDSICITVEDNRVDVSAQKEAETSAFKHRQTMERTYFLPENVQADELRCDLSCDGVLVLSAPWRVK